MPSRERIQAIIDRIRGKPDPWLNDEYDMSDNDIIPGTVEPYVLPEQHPRTEHPESIQPHEIVTGPQWGDLITSITDVPLLLGNVRHFFFVTRDPRNDPAWLTWEPQLQDAKAALEWHKMCAQRQLDQINRFLGVHGQ